jgi:hypothetical protein
MIEPMSKLEVLEQQILELNADEKAEFFRWVVELRAEEWDARIERDIEAGKLDSMADAALQRFAQGKFKEI